LENNDNDFCINCGNPKLYIDKPCTKCGKNNSDCEINNKKFKFNISKYNLQLILSIIFCLGFFYVFANQDAICGPDYNHMHTNNLQTIKYMKQAQLAKTIPEQIILFAKAANALDKNDLSKQNAITIAQVNFNIGLNASKINRLDVSAKAYFMGLSALKKADAFTNNDFCFLILNNLSMSLQTLGDVKNAKEYYQELVKTQTKAINKYPFHYTKAYYELSFISLQQEKYEESLDQTLKGLTLLKNNKLADKSKSKFLYTLLSLRAGELFNKLSNYKNALIYLNNAKNNTDIIVKDPLHIGKIYSNIGLAQYKLNNLKQAQIAYEQAIKHFNNVLNNKFYLPPNTIGCNYISCPERKESYENLIAIYDKTGQKLDNREKLEKELKNLQYIPLNESNYKNITNIITNFN